MSLSMIWGTLALTSLAIAAIASLCLLQKLNEQLKPPTSYPPITVIKPLKGLDDGLYENLAAIARQDYPSFEILFCAEDADDPALAVARQVQRDFPAVVTRVVSGGMGDGLNPKVRILRRSLLLCATEWLLISDSNVRPSNQYLKRLVGYQQQHDAALVHSVLAGVGERSVGARLENLQMNGWIAASIAMCDAGQHPCVIGKSMFTTKTALAGVGGLEAVKDILAEDYVLGARLTEHGKKVALCPDVLPVVGGARDIMTFVNRHVRWGQMRRRIKPVFFLGEIMVNPLPFFVLLALSGTWHFAALAGFGMTLKWAMDIYVHRRLASKVRWTSLLFLPFKDALLPFIWAAGGLKRRVSWRGNSMRIGPGSRLTPVAEGRLEAVFEQA